MHSVWAQNKWCARSWTFQHKSCLLCLLLWSLPGFITIPFINYDIVLLCQNRFLACLNGFYRWHCQAILKVNILLFPSAGDGFGSGMTRTKAVITHEGLVSLNVPTIIESSCQIHVESYPFDQQNCELKFGSWTYDESGIALNLEVHIYPKK